MSKFEEVLKIVNGKNQKKVENPNGIYPIYGSGGIIGYSDEYICEANTIVIGRKGNINKPIFVERKFWNVDTAFGLVAKKEKLMPKYLYYFCENYNFEKHNSTVTIPSLTKANLLKIEIFVPSLEIQIQIIQSLDKLRKLIDLRMQQIEKMDLLVKSQFIEMFGDPVQNEKNWPMVRLADIAMIRIGPFGSLLHREDYIENGHALVNPSHIIDGAIVADRTLTISEDKYRELSAYKLEIGDIVLGRRGEMGRCAVVCDDGLICGTGSLLIRSGVKIKPYFLQKIISYPTFKSVIEEKSVGVTMQNLNVPIVSNLLIPSLPLELQEQYLFLVEQVDKSKFAMNQSLERLEQCRNALMQKAFG